MEIFNTTTIEVGLAFDDYINKFDFSLDSANLEELLDTNKDHGLNAYTPSLLLTQIVNNFILLFPIIYKKNNKENYEFSEMDEIVSENAPEFYWCTDSNGNYIFDDENNVIVEEAVNKPFLQLRNRLAHGAYKLVRENNDIFITYHYKSKGNSSEKVYKKISVKTLMKLCNALIEKNFDYSNRFAVALVNNMKILYGLIDRFNSRE